uniref:Uncharacterized protein n=1 Tax=Rhizophora mucronata TaxID=61149 RepID=A0A2P2K9I7_RHIMU
MYLYEYILYLCSLHLSLKRSMPLDLLPWYSSIMSQKATSRNT